MLSPGNLYESVPGTNDELPIGQLLSARRASVRKSLPMNVQLSAMEWQPFSSEHPVYLRSQVPDKIRVSPEATFHAPPTGGSRKAVKSVNTVTLSAPRRKQELSSSPHMLKGSGNAAVIGSHQKSRKRHSLDSTTRAQDLTIKPKRLQKQHRTAQRPAAPQPERRKSLPIDDREHVRQAFPDEFNAVRDPYRQAYSL